MRLVLCSALLFALPAFADEKSDIAALKTENAVLTAELTDLKARIANHEKRIKSAEDWGGAMGGYRPPVGPIPTKSVAAPAKSINLREQPKPATVAPTVTFKANMVHCIQYTDMTKTKIAREWDEPAGTSASGCASGQCPAVRLQLPVKIQGGCPNGQCPNAGVPVRGGYFPG